MRKAIEDEGIISWFPAAENNVLLQTWRQLLLGAMDWC